jgi:hypothetical protein
MGSNKRDLKAYVRYDGSGRVVAGSLILRRNKPKVGNWKEVQGYECCNQNQSPIIVEVDGGFPFTYASIEIGNNDGPWFQPIRSYTNLTANDIDELAALYNANFPNLGTFKVEYGNLVLYPSANISAFYTAVGVTSLYAYAFED